MRTPLVWLNLVLATVLGLLYTQRDLFFPEPPPDLVAIVRSEAGVAPDSDPALGIQAFARDWKYRVTTLVSDGSARSLAKALKDAIALKPRGITMPGDRDSELLLPFVTEAQRAGILVTFHSTPFPEAERLYRHMGAGYMGARSRDDGELAAKAVLAQLRFAPGKLVLVAGTEAEATPGSFGAGCIAGIQAMGGRAEYLGLPTAAMPTETQSARSMLEGRIAAEPYPDLIFWNAGSLERLTSVLADLDADPDKIGVVNFDTAVALPLDERLYLKYQLPGQDFVATYLSLVQLHLSLRYRINGMHVPFGRSL